MDAVQVEDRIRQLSSSTGTGNFTVSASALTGCRTLAESFAVGDRFYYTIDQINEDGSLDGSFEQGEGTLLAGEVSFSRDRVIKSSNGNALVDFAEGKSKIVYVPPTKELIQPLTTAGQVPYLAANGRMAPAPNLSIGSNGKIHNAIGINNFGLIEGVFLTYGANISQVDSTDYYSQVYSAMGPYGYGCTVIYASSRSPDGITHVALQNNDYIHSAYFYGDTGSTLSWAASLHANVDGVPTADSVPGRFDFRTNPVGSTAVPPIRLSIRNDGKVGINQDTPTATLEVDSLGAAIPGVVVQGAGSQSAALQDWKDSTGKVIARVRPNGIVEAGSTGIIVNRTDTSGVGIGHGNTALTAVITFTTGVALDFRTEAGDSLGFVAAKVISPGHANTQIRWNGMSEAQFQSVGIGAPCWTFDTDIAISSGKMLQVLNLGTTIYSLGFDGRVYQKAPNSAPTDGDLAAAQITFYLDESGNNLKVRVKYADGTTLKTGTIALT